MGRPKLKLPPVPEPVAIPQVDDETLDQQMLKVRRRSGLERTYVTGALAPKSKKSTILGA